MNLQKEKEKVEKLEKILDCISSANNRIRIYKEVDEALTPLFSIGNLLSANRERTAANISRTKAAKAKLEKYYLKVLSNGIDFTKDLPR